MRVFLIGMPGSGKSTIGKKVASMLDYDFIDLDVYIEIKSCMFIDEIFTNYGEKYFRDLETNCLEDLVAKENVIVSCGGGIVINKRNKKLMNGKVILLEVNNNELQKRINNSKDIRPLFKTKTIAELYVERHKLYQDFADVTFFNYHLTETVNKIVEYVGVKNA